MLDLDPTHSLINLEPTPSRYIFLRDLRTPLPANLNVQVVSQRVSSTWWIVGHGSQPNGNYSFNLFAGRLNWREIIIFLDVLDKESKTFPSLEVIVRSFTLRTGSLFSWYCPDQYQLKNEDWPEIYFVKVPPGLPSTLVLYLFQGLSYFQENIGYLIPSPLIFLSSQIMSEEP